MEHDGDRIGRILFKGQALSIFTGQYLEGNVAIYLTEPNHSLYTTLTINLPDKLEEGEFFIKNWSENEELAPSVLKETDLFEDTGKKVKTGFVEAPIWRWKEAP